MPTYTYGVFDGAIGSDTMWPWPPQAQRTVQADTPEAALQDVLATALRQARASGDYEAGQRIGVAIWDEDGIMAAQGYGTTTERPVVRPAVINPDIFAQQMQALLTSSADDPEVFHIAADKLLCTALAALGYQDGVRIFLDAEKWYA